MAYTLQKYLPDFIRVANNNNRNACDGVQLQDSLADGPAKLKEITDPTIHETFAFDSLQTLVTVALNCVANDHRERPSIDDILWNLQYSVQVQDGWTSSDGLSIHPYN